MGRERRDFVRRSGFRDASLVVIACEGAVTEPDYFNDVKARLHVPGLHVEVLQREDPENSSPQRVLRMLDEFSARFRLRDGDTLWLVMDRDQQSWKPQTLSEVATACVQRDYRLALSNPCFELWLLLHFEDVPSHPTERRDELLANKDHLLKGLVAERRRSAPEALDVLGAEAPMAISRARLLDSSPEDRWPQELGTRVYLLLEHLLDAYRRRAGLE
jgi:hypothetical protein